MPEIVMDDAWDKYSLLFFRFRLICDIFADICILRLLMTLYNGPVMI